MSAIAVVIKKRNFIKILLRQRLSTRWTESICDHHGFAAPWAEAGRFISMALTAGGDQRFEIVVGDLCLDESRVGAAGGDGFFQPLFGVLSIAPKGRGGSQCVDLSQD